MRLKKESMRQIADAGMVQRAQRNIDDSVADPIGFVRHQDRKPPEQRTYVRGALVKLKHNGTRK